MSNKKLIYGFHAVNARLFQNPKSLLELYIATGRQDARMRDAILKAESEGIRILSVDSARLDGMSGHARHQGIAALIDTNKTRVDADGSTTIVNSAVQVGDVVWYRIAVTNNGTATEITFPDRVVTSVQLKVTAVSTTTERAGLAEFEAWGTTGGTPTNQPPTANAGQDQTAPTDAVPSSPASTPASSRTDR